MEPNEFPPEVSKPRTSVAAIASLVCGLLACIPFLTGLAAIILGIVGIKKTRNPMVTGKGMAIAGLILGVLSLAGWAVGSVTIVAGVYAIYQAAEPARLVGEEFTRDLNQGKVDAAVALSVEGIDREALTALSQKMKPWGEFQKLAITTVNIQQNNAQSSFVIGGAAIFANESKVYSMTLTKEGEAYKVEAFDFK